MSVNLIKDPVMQRSDESAESDQSSTRSKCLNKLRTISLSMVFCSFVLIVVAFSKDQFLYGEIWNGDAAIVHQGMFQSCTTTTYGVNSIVYECTHTFRHFWTSKTPNMWPVASGMLLAETLIQLALFYLMIRRPVLKNTRVVKYALSFMFIVCAISGLIVVSVAGNVRDVMNGEHFMTRTVSWSWSWDVSMYLIFVAYPLSVVGYILYCVGWKLEVGAKKTSVSALLQPKELNESEATIVQLQPVISHAPHQQVTITVNGQTMLLTLSPVQHQPPATPSSPSLADINYVSNPAAHTVYQNYPNPNPMVLMNGQPMHHVYPHLPQYNQVQGSYLPYGHGELTTSLPV